MIVSRTPLRISLGGGGTDLPFYANKFGGSLVTAAINQYVYLTVSPRVEKDFKLNYAKTEVVEDIKEIQHPLIREALLLSKIKDAAEIHSTMTVPSGTGLGSSSAFTVGLLNALNYSNGEMVSRYKLAEDTSHITMDILKEPCGKQDQYASAFGGLNHLKISKTGRVTVTPINISHEKVKELEQNLMLFYTGFRRSSIGILAHQKEKAEKRDEEDIFNYYHEIKKIGEESLKALEKGDLSRFGRLLHVHWELKRGISAKMSNPEINKWYSLAMENGALGGKLIGAGGGGFLMVYVERNHDRVKAALEKEGLSYMQFKFDFDGSRIVYDGKHF